MGVRARDPLWDAWVAEWGEPLTGTERGRLNRALKELREIGATPEQITRALRAYDRDFRGCTRSPQGVTGNWRTLQGMNGTSRTEYEKASDVCIHCGGSRGEVERTHGPNSVCLLSFCSDHHWKPRGVFGDDADSALRDFGL